MRLSVASMALSLTTLLVARQQVRAFTPHAIRSFTATTSHTFRKATIEEGTEVGKKNVDVVFPMKGKDPLEAPPRMRFAPSPTGRYVWYRINEYTNPCRSDLFSNHCLFLVSKPSVTVFM